MPRVDTNGISTYYERHGDGPPVVLAHGLGNDRRWWDPQVEGLADGYELVVYDVRGHGRSEESDWNYYSMDLLADDLHALVEALDLDRPVVGGHSLGGMFVQTYAVQYPDALSALVVVDAQTDVVLTRKQRVITRVLMPATKGMYRTIGRERAQAIQQWIATHLLDLADGEDEDGDEDGADDADRDDLETYLDEARRLPDDELFKFVDGLRDFRGVDGSAIAVPTLLAYGGEVAMMQRNAAKLEAEVPDVTRRDFADEGHSLSWTAAGEFNEVLRTFLADVDVPGQEHAMAETG